MLYGIKGKNGFDEPRSFVLEANDIETAKRRFFNENCRGVNRYKIDTIKEVIPNKCSLLYQIQRDIVGETIVEPKVMRDNYNKLCLEINNVLRFGTVVFQEGDLHWNGEMIEIMVCLADGTPNWIY